MRRLLAFARLSTGDKCLLLHAGLAVSMVHLALSLLSWRDVQGLLECPRILKRSSAGDPLDIDRLVWAVEHASSLVPGARCLTRAATLQFLLRHTSEPSCLRIGVAKDPDGRFSAHAWVESRGKPLIGKTQVTAFKPLLPVRSDPCRTSPVPPA